MDALDLLAAGQVAQHPVRLQQRLMGEITLFYNTSVALSPEEAELLDALASHLASALEGLRAEALEREAAVGEERAMLARELHEELGLQVVSIATLADLMQFLAATDDPVLRANAERVAAYRARYGV